ncbi:hypothetical protein DFH07DRAFT_807114 [Mycena maculata]|uniref:Uncharacterized protein n=1 Tax=Mycena maculata TaxID=230809 RepID=A0AAD7NP23_9AGAR|nr:hypothetical protein DFH07DRAFT_807114 [Mycena maculata]
MIAGDCRRGGDGICGDATSTKRPLSVGTGAMGKDRIMLSDVGVQRSRVNVTSLRQVLWTLEGEGVGRLPGSASTMISAVSSRESLQSESVLNVITGISVFVCVVSFSMATVTGRSWPHSSASGTGADGVSLDHRSRTILAGKMEKIASLF